MADSHQHLLSSLERRLLQISTWAVVGLFTPVLALIQWGEYAQGRYDGILAGQAVVHLVCSLLLVAPRSQGVRATALVTYLLVSSLVTLLHYGPNVNAGMIWVLTALLGLIYLGNRGLVLTLAAVLATMGVAAVAHTLDPSLYQGAGEVHLASTWIRLTATAAVVLTAVALMVTAIIRRFGNAAQQATEALARERAERAEREAAEKARRTAERAMADAQRQELVGRIAAGAAHDLNNVLTAIFGSAELALLRPDRAHEEIPRIQEAAQRAAAMSRQLLAFSRQHVSQPRSVDAVEVLQGISRLLDRLLPSSIQRALVLPDEPVPVHVDPSQLEQVVLNLCVNARDAMHGGGMLSVRLEVVEGHPWLVVSDTGEGMDENLQEHIFEPFFTTKEEGRGTGLGLATVQTIVQDWQGEIEVESAPGHGTTFRVRLPWAEGSLEPLPEARPERKLRGTERVLVVDDDPQVRALARQLLADAGYSAEEAPNGSQALTLLKRRHADLVLLDVVMPGLSGPPLVLQLLRCQPDVRILHSTGYDPGVFDHGYFEDPANRLLLKPYTRAELLHAVRETLDG